MSKPHNSSKYQIKRTKIFLVIVNSIVSELEMYLPVYEEIKKKDPLWLILVVYGDSKIQKLCHEDVFIFSKLEEYSAYEAVVPVIPVHHLSTIKFMDSAFNTLMKKRLIFEIVEYLSAFVAIYRISSVLKSVYGKIEVIASNHANGKLLFKRKLKRKYKDALAVAMPHGETPRYLDKNNLLKTSQKVDLVLLPTSDLSLAYYKKYFMASSYENREFFVTGSPRLEKKWLDDKKFFYSSKNNSTILNIPNNYNVVLFFSRHANRKFLSNRTRDDLFREVCDAVLSEPNGFLIVKPHPREKLDDCLRILQEFDSRQWIVTRDDKTLLIDKCSIVVSMWSGAVVDAVQQGKPVIEHFRFEKFYDGLIRTPKGITSIYRVSGVCVESNSVDQLKRYLNDYFNEVEMGNPSCWKCSKEIILNCLGQSEGAATRAANSILTHKNFG